MRAEVIQLPLFAICNMCGEVKPPEAFHAHPHSAKRIQAHCASCGTEYQREWREYQKIKKEADKRWAERVGAA